MNRDDIIRMAREAGFDKWDNTCLSGKSDLDEKLAVGEYAIGEAVFKFAALVAAAEREGMAINSIHSCHSECQRPICVAVREAVAAEREACAKVCDELVLEHPGRADLTAKQCAFAIRERGAP